MSLTVALCKIRVIMITILHKHGKSYLVLKHREDRTCYLKWSTYIDTFPSLEQNTDTGASTRAS